MYAYCGNNPVIRCDVNGCAWEVCLIFFVETVTAVAAIATVFDINYLYQNGGLTISSDFDHNGVYGLELKESNKILTPWVQLGYSAYINYFNEDYKDEIKGSSTGMVFEWQMHNVPYYAGKFISSICKLVNINVPEIIDVAVDKGKNVEFGRTIYHDYGDDARGLFSAAMKTAYVLAAPVVAFVDFVVSLFS